MKKLLVDKLPTCCYDCGLYFNEHCRFYNCYISFDQAKIKCLKNCPLTLGAKPLIITPIKLKQPNKFQVVLMNKVIY